LGITRNVVAGDHKGAGLQNLTLRT
jgi:hypothetical protein